MTLERCENLFENTSVRSPLIEPAANALVGGPVEHAGFRILVQRLEWTSRGARPIQTVHTLPFSERERGTVFRLLKLDGVAG
jgi:hypothetical protein